MDSVTIKKEIIKKEYTAAERLALSVQSPFFVKKNQDAEAFLKKVGLPKRFDGLSKSQ